MDRVRRFYDEKVLYEWQRLDRHRTEFALTLRVFRDYLPKPQAKILDVGGGPGRYSIALAQQGYSVTLFDLSKQCLEFAKSKAAEVGVSLEGYVHGNATDLNIFPAESYDIVLLMGPLYHLLLKGEREKALQEASRVLKTSGLIFASFITRYAVIRWAAKDEPSWILKNRKRTERLLASGIIRARKGDGFTDAYFIHPSDVKPFMEKAGFETLDLIATEGVISMIEEKVNELTGELWEAWVELNYKLGKDPTVHGAAEHLLYVGKKLPQARVNR